MVLRCTTGTVMGTGLAAFAVLLPARTRAGAPVPSVHVRTRTLGEAYVVRPLAEGGELLTRRRVVQYVDLGVAGLLPPRNPIEPDPDRATLTMQSSLRLRHEFGTLARGADAEVWRSLDGRQIDVLYGYLEGRRVLERLDFRLGRQFEMSGLDWYGFDGVWARLKMPAHLAVEAFAGTLVDGAAVFGAPTFEPDGRVGAGVGDDTLRGDGHRAVAGTALALHGFRHAAGRTAYRRTWVTAARGDTQLGSENGPAVTQELISSTFAVRLAQGRIEPLAAVRYDLGLATWSDIAAGLNVRLGERHRASLGYARTTPVFDLDSIFNVFSAEPFEEFRLRWTAELQPGVALTARAQERRLQDEAARWGHGGGLSLHAYAPRWSVTVDGFGLAGHGGGRLGGGVYGRRQLGWQRFVLDGRATAVRFEARVPESGASYGVSAAGGGRVRFWEGVYFGVDGEWVHSSFLRNAVRMMAVLDAQFGLRVGRRPL